jgi:hypothetical protein
MVGSSVEFLRSPPVHNWPIWGDTPGREASGPAVTYWLVVDVFSGSGAAVMGAELPSG